MTVWCQNKKCPEKKTQGQIRGNKGNKYYQSNKAGWYGHWCSMGCREAWFNEHKDTCLQAVGIIDKQTIACDDAWYVQHDYRWGTGESNDLYSLCNKLKGVKRTITRQQAQTSEQISNDYRWQTIDDTQAKELAVTLGLTS